MSGTTTATSVGNVTAAQGQSTLLQNPVQRQIEQGELISPSANAETASKFTEQIGDSCNAFKSGNCSRSACNVNIKL